MLSQLCGLGQSTAAQAPLNGCFGGACHAMPTGLMKRRPDAKGGVRDQPNVMSDFSPLLRLLPSILYKQKSITTGRRSNNDLTIHGKLSLAASEVN